MAKRTQEQKEEEIVVSKSRLAAMNLASSTSTSSSTASSPIVSESPGMPIASGIPDSRESIDPNSFDAASDSPVRLKDAYFGGFVERQWRNPSHQEEEDSEDSDNLEAEIWYFKGKQVTVNKFARAFAKWTQAWGRRLSILISYIHHTNDHRQYCHVGNTAQHCGLGFFQDSDLIGDFEDSKSTLGQFHVFRTPNFCPH